MKNDKAQRARIPVTAAAPAAWPVVIRHRPSPVAGRSRFTSGPPRVRLVRRSGSVTVTLEAVRRTAARPALVVTRRSYETSHRV